MTFENYNLYDLFITEEAARKASSYFARVENGQDEIYRTPLFNEGNPANILQSWIDILQLNRKEVEICPGLLGFEEEMAEKVGPLSVMLPLKDRIPDIESYYKLINLKSKPIELEAINKYRSKLAKIKVTPWDFARTTNSMRLSTNSGVPYFARRRKVLYETKVIMYEGKWYVAILGWRGQEGGPEVDDIKQRVVWMFPLAVNIRELSVYSPLILEWQKFNINSAYISIRAVEEKITKCFDTADDDYIIVTDFSKYDQHFNTDLQECAYLCLESMLSGHDGKEWLREVFPIKYNIPLAISDKIMIKGRHGMGSGSGGTNFDECCAHACLQEEAALLANAELNPYSNAYGDDGYLTYPGIDVDHVIKCYSSHGQELNPSKQSVSKDSAVYLRRYFNKIYRDKSNIMLGVYSTCRALGRLMYQERYYKWDDEVEYSNYVVLRAWSILENCCHHPLFETFVDYVVKGDKYGLGTKIPGFMERFEKDFNKLRELDPDVLGFTKDQQSSNVGVKDWKVYKYLKSKAH